MRINERGNTIEDDFFCDRDRYYYDHRLGQDWHQYDTWQDAHYFGVWVNVKKRQILTYAEGDVSLVKCLDQEHLRTELKSMEEFYGAPPPAAIAIGLDGTRTKYYDTRPSAD